MAKEIRHLVALRTRMSMTDRLIGELYRVTDENENYLRKVVDGLPLDAITGADPLAVSFQKTKRNNLAKVTCMEEDFKKMTIEEAWTLVRDAAASNKDYSDDGPRDGRHLGWALMLVEHAVFEQS